MLVWSRLPSQVAIVCAVVLLTGVGAAQGVGAEEEAGNHATNAEVVSVSGEAFGAHVEIDALLAPGTLDSSALLAAARTGDVATVRALAAARLGEISAANGVVPTPFHSEAGPEPEVELPSSGGGPLSDSEDELDIQDTDETLNIYDRSEVETEGRLGRDGFATTSAEVSGLGGDNFIEELEVECRADLEDVDGSTSIESPFTEFPKHPDPDTVIEEFDETETDPSNPNLFVRARFRQVVNVQDEDDDAITVDAYTEHLTIEFFDLSQSPDPIEFYDFDATVGHVHCDVEAAVPATPVVVEPTFTG